jgi:outer membrane biosynthesis protein TonB
MPKKYRLVRTDPGVLDLSQVLDEQGKPVLLKKAGDFAVVNETATQHPLIKRFIGAGLQLEEVSLTPVQAPATPVVDKVTAPPKPAPEPPKPEPTPPPEPPPAPPEVVTKEDAPKDESKADDESDDESETEDAPEETSEGSSWAKPKTTKKTKKSTKRGK